MSGRLAGGRVDITVLGGGCLGLSAALALAEEGHDVVVREARQLGAGSTAKAAGICSTMTWNDDDYALIAATRGRVGELISLAAGAVPAARGAWRSHDSITIARGEKSAALDDMQDRLERNTEEPQRLDWRRAAAQFPDLRFHPGEEVLVAQEDGVIEAGDWLAAMAWRLDAEGVRVVQGGGLAAGDASTTPGDAAAAPGRAAAVSGRAAASPRLATLARPDTEGVVVAAGAWTRGVLAAWGHALPLKHFRAQAMTIGIADALAAPIVHDTVHGFYSRPESAATMIAGDGTVLRDHPPDDYNERGDPDFIEHVAAGVAQRFAAGGAGTARTSWAGLCVATPDRHPLCGPVPDADGLWVLSGDNGFGLMRAMGLGERLAAAVDGRVASATDPRRFSAGVADDWPMREGFAF
jgi:glycine/D-amino acid oxidase-like deaminating enzyme